MKWTSALACVVCFLFAFFFAKERPEIVSKALPPFSQAPASPPITPPPAAPLVDLLPLHLTLQQEKGGRLYQQLFSQDLTKVFSENSTLASLEIRFQKNYPSQEGKFNLAQEEVISRLGILKALGKEETTAPQKALTFYQRIINNPKENWLVKRQALKNALAFSNLLTENAREKLLRSPLLVATAGKTDQEILQEFLHE